MSEPLDRNKSSLTHRITAGVETFLADKGFKPVETEVPLAKCWVADVAGVVVPSRTELQKLKLVPTKPRLVYDFKHSMSMREKYGDDWYQNKDYLQSPQYAAKKKKEEKYQQKLTAWEQELKEIPAPLTALVEVKTTKTDFARDDKWCRVSPANLRYLAIPAGMLKRSDFPVGWFVLEFGDKGKLIRVAQKGSLEKVDIEQQMWTIHEIAVRRHHRTHYDWIRSLQKKYKAEDTKQKQNLRLNNIVRTMIDVASGGGKMDMKSVEECFNWRGIKYGNLPSDVKQQLEALWGIAPHLNKSKLEPSYLRRNK